jgi:hypothetical protein
MANDYPLPRRRFAIAAKEEAAYGTPETINFATDAFRLTEVPSVRPMAAVQNTRDEWVTGGLGGLIPAPASGSLVEISGRAVFVGPGVAYAASTTPNIHPLLVTAFSAAVDTNPSTESWTYDISDSPSTGITVEVAYAGKKVQASGCVLSALTMEMEYGKWPVFAFTLLGIYQSIVEADLPAATYYTDLPPICEDSALTLGSHTPVWRSARLELGLEVALRGDGNATNAHQGYRIVKRAPRFTVTMETDLLATFDPWSQYFAATEIAGSFRVGGAPVAGNQYNRLAWDADSLAVVEDPQETDLDGLSGLEVTYGVFTPSSGTQLQLLAD